MAKTPLVIVDRSGSMASGRFEKCKNFVNIQMPGQKTVWYFGTEVQKVGVHTVLPPVSVNCGTRIGNMLNILHDHMSATTGEEVYLFTDDQDSYDASHFRGRFNGLTDRSHSVCVIDICGADVKRLRTVFEGFGSFYANNLDALSQGLTKIKTLIAEDTKIIKTVTDTEKVLAELDKNLTTITQEKNTIEKKVGTNAQKIGGFQQTMAQQQQNPQKKPLEELNKNLHAHSGELTDFLEDIDMKLDELTHTRNLIKSKEKALMRLQKDVHRPDRAEQIKKKQDEIAGYIKRSTTLSDELGLCRDTSEQQYSDLLALKDKVFQTLNQLK